MSIEVLNWDQAPPAACRRGALAIGNFDGVHRGHLALLGELRRQATALKGPAVALTFDPHPLQLLQPERFQPVLTTLADRAKLLAKNGADHVVILRTTPEMLQVSANDFFRQVIQQGFAARALVEGVNFGFGRNREGTVETLTRLCHQADVALTIVPPFQQDDAIVSSSRVRQALVKGAVREAEKLLARSYQIHGTVGRGQERGRTIGFPTANLERIETLVPGDGVYAVRVHVGATLHAGAANIGPNPTFGEMARKVEVHLIDFAGDLYGQVLAIEFVDRLRDTRPFASAAQLNAQLHRDVQDAKVSVLGPR